MRKSPFWRSVSRNKDKKFRFEAKINWYVLAQSAPFPNWRYLLVKIRTFFDENPDCEL